MSCKLPEELRALHAGGDLTVAEASQVEAHIASCALCTSELSAFRAARVALQEIRETERPSESLWSELDARLDAVDAAGRHRLPWFRRGAFAPVLMTAAALLLAVVFYPGSEAGPGIGDQNPVIAQPAENEEPGLHPASFPDLLHMLRVNPAAVPNPDLVSEPATKHHDTQGLDVAPPEKKEF